MADTERSFDPVPRPAAPTAVKEGGRGTGFSPNDTRQRLDVVGDRSGWGFAV